MIELVQIVCTIAATAAACTWLVTNKPKPPKEPDICDGCKHLVWRYKGFHDKPIDCCKRETLMTQAPLYCKYREQIEPPAPPEPPAPKKPSDPREYEYYDGKRSRNPICANCKNCIAYSAEYNSVVCKKTISRPIEPHYCCTSYAPISYTNNEPERSAK